MYGVKTVAMMGADTMSKLTAEMRQYY